MKKLIVLLLVVALLSIGCGDVKTIDGVTYDTYGVFTMNTDANPDIRYRLIIGNVVWSVLLCQTIVMPIYFVGFSLWEPIGRKDDNYIKGAVR